MTDTATRPTQDWITAAPNDAPRGGAAHAVFRLAQEYEAALVKLANALASAGAFATHDRNHAIFLASLPGGVGDAKMMAFIDQTFRNRNAKTSHLIAAFYPAPDTSPASQSDSLDAFIRRQLLHRMLAPHRLAALHRVCVPPKQYPAERTQ